MAENKTKPTGASVDAFIDAVDDERRRAECRILIGLMKRMTGLEPVIWGPSMVGFGRYAYRYPSGHSGESFLTGFSPRKAAIAVYIVAGFSDYGDLLARLGPHTHSVSCLYIKRLDRVDLDVLAQMIADSVRVMRERYPLTA